MANTGPTEDSTAKPPPRKVYYIGGTEAADKRIAELFSKQHSKNWKEGVAKVQDEFGCHVPGTDAPLRCLEYLGVRPNVVYPRLVEELVKKFMDRIPQLDQNHLEKLFEMMWPYVGVPELRDIPRQAVKHMQTTPAIVKSSFNEAQKGMPLVAFMALDLPFNAVQDSWEADLQMFRNALMAQLDVWFALPKMGALAKAAMQVAPRRPFSVRGRQNEFKTPLGEVVRLVGSRASLLQCLCATLGERFAAEADHDTARLWCSVLIDVLQQVREKQKARTDGVWRLCALAGRLNQHVQQHSMDDQNVADLQGLFREAGEVSLDGNLNKQEGTDDKQLTAVLLRAWETISGYDKANIFAKAVTDAVAPGYSKIIRTPMSLDVVLRKIKAKEYGSLEDFERDIRRMYQNCREYNKAGTGYHEAAVKQLQRWEKEGRVRVLAGSRSLPAMDKKRKREPDTKGRAAPLPPRDDLPKTAGWAAMLLGEPFVAKLMMDRLVDCLEECGNRLMLPNDHPSIPILVQLLAIGQAAKEMHNQGRFYIPAVGDTFMKVILPKVALLLLQMKYCPSPDVARGEEGDDVRTAREKAWKQLFKESWLARRLVGALTCRAVWEGDRGRLAWLFQPAMQAAKHLSGEPWFWRTMEASIKNTLSGKREQVRLDDETYVGVLKVLAAGANTSGPLSPAHTSLLRGVLTFMPPKAEGEERGAEPHLGELGLELLMDVAVKRLAKHAAGDPARARELWTTKDFAVNRRLYEEILSRWPPWVVKMPEGCSVDASDSMDLAA